MAHVPATEHSGLARPLARLGRACVRHRWWVVAAWVVALVAVSLAGRMAGGVPNSSLSVPGLPAAEGATVADRAFSDLGAASGQVVVQAPSGTLAEPERVAALAAAIERMRRVEGIVSVSDPATTPGAIAPGGATALVAVAWSTPSPDLGRTQFRALEKAAEPLRAAGLRVAFAGSPAEEAEEQQSDYSELIGLAAAVVILLLAFGSVVTMTIPIAMALVALGTALSILTLLESVVAVSDVARTLATMIGLGVGIDYGLFVVTRHRQQLAGGMTVEDSVAHSLATAGRAVLMAGATVAVAVLGLAAAGIPFVTRLGQASAIAVAVAVTAALTLLPAALGIAGGGLDRLRIPGIRGPGPVTLEGPDGRPHGWARWSLAVSRHPWPPLVAAVTVLIVLSLPMLWMRLGQVDAGSDPPGTTTRLAYDITAQAFGPGSNGPVTLVVSSRDRGAAVRAAAAAKRDPDVLVTTPPRYAPGGEVAIVTVVPRTAPTDSATADLVSRLAVEAGIAAGPAARVFPTGVTAVLIDLSDRVSARLPWFIGAVILISVLLLAVEFRSVLVPVKAAVMNVLSISAAYGVVVAIFQWGWGLSLFGVEETVAIEAWVPMMMFAILFGLSMDYEVFLLSRIREEWDATGDPHRSVAMGVAGTARVISAAALIMASVFLAFVATPNVVVKMLGVGLATAVLVDATVVRLVLVPSTMVLLGKANWWLPRPIARLVERRRPEPAPETQ